MAPNLRLIRLVEEVARAGVPIAPPALAAALDLPKPTIHRLLHTAEAEGLVQRHIDGRSYGPGRRLRLLAANTLSAQRVRTERLAIMRGLAAEIGETCNLAVPGRDGMVYIDRVETHWALRIQLPIGSRVPFHCTASGKLYLSTLAPARLKRWLAALPMPAETPRTLTSVEALMEELAHTKLRGYSLDDEEFMEGMAAIAVPICDDRGRLLSTLSVHAPVQRHDLPALTAHLDRLREAAAALRSLVLDERKTDTAGTNAPRA